MLTVPSTWKRQQLSNDGNTLTYTRPGHTVKQPKLAIVSRVIPSYDTGRATWSVPSYRVRVFDGVLNADGQPDPTRTLYDLTVRASINSDGSAVVADVHSDFLLVVNQADFAANAIGAQEFPSPASE
ncbi:MAG: hypothetical protein FuLV1_gp2 [Hangzhou levivirus 1]|nr:MAG: hypothetical protein FuLV1_gp2 [Hangzhou levivirus 1]